METTAIPDVPLGKRDMVVNEYSLGCAPLGALPSTPTDEDLGQAMLQAAWDGGIRTFDVAPFYGLGRAEIRLGRFLSGRRRDDYVLSTKVGRLLAPAEDGVGTPTAVFDFSRDGILASLECSLTRLGLDRVDVALIHDPDDHFATAIKEAYPALEELRAAGVVRAIGVGMNQAGMLEQFVRDTDIDCVLVAGRYTLLDDRAEQGLFPAALERGVGVLAAGVFNSGILADPRPGATFNYRPAPPDVLDRATRLRDLAARHRVPLTRLALRFALRHPAVSAIVVGARSPDEVAQDLAEYGAPVPDELWEELEASGLTRWATVE
jgi:D-threo-aldose 1-dehydrogenase